LGDISHCRSGGARPARLASFRALRTKLYGEGLSPFLARAMRENAKRHGAWPVEIRQPALVVWNMQY
jgi:hypothetical protein